MTVVNDVRVYVLRPMSVLGEMRVIRGQFWMAVLNHLGVVGGPDDARHDHGEGRPGRQHQRREGEPQHRSRPSGEGIGDEPAGMGEGELGGEDCRAVFGMS